MFTPLKDKSRREMILDLAAQHTYGDIIRYTDIETTLEVDRRTAQTAMHQTVRSLERTQNKTVEAVTNIGYRIVNPAEHLRLATAQQRKSGRSIRRAKSKVDHIDMTGMSDGERTAITLAATALAGQIELARRSDLRYANREATEGFIREQSGKNEHTAEQLNEMKARMERLEARIAKDDK